MISAVKIFLQLKDYGFSLEEMHAIGARCGALIPVYEGGIFLIDDYMCQALIDTPVRHAANLGAQIAKKFADSQGSRLILQIRMYWMK